MDERLIKPGSVRSAAIDAQRAGAIPRDMLMPMSVVFRKDAPPGPAARAFIAQLKR